MAETHGWSLKTHGHAPPIWAQSNPQSSISTSTTDLQPPIWAKIKPTTIDLHLHHHLFEPLSLFPNQIKPVSMVNNEMREREGEREDLHKYLFLFLGLF